MERLASSEGRRELRARLEEWVEKRYASIAKIPVLVFEGSSRELGSVCRKPFMVSALAVLDPGESTILQMAKGE
ncbi:MAG: ribosomal L7Ae/L30e/S12e/Gadd45 family protein [Thermofilum sp.]